MKIGVTSAALEYAITVTALSVPIAILGFGFTSIIDAVLGDLSGQLSVLAVVVGG